MTRSERSERDEVEVQREKTPTEEESGVLDDAPDEVEVQSHVTGEEKTLTEKELRMLEGIVHRAGAVGGT
jgi:hypothetical protein